MILDCNAWLVEVFNDSKFGIIRKIHGFLEFISNKMVYDSFCDLRRHKHSTRISSLDSIILNEWLNYLLLWTWMTFTDVVEIERYFIMIFKVSQKATLFRCWVIVITPLRIKLTILRFKFNIYFSLIGDKFIQLRLFSMSDFEKTF